MVYINIYKSIFKPKIARELLRLGNPIHDIKACKENTDRTIFIFEITEKFTNDLATVQKQ
jgi:hypothetical protein